ncbi:MAG TPA: DUF6159 family protein [Acidimicrobiales bacterium]|jgi:hypothetical protein
MTSGGRGLRILTNSWQVVRDTPVLVAVMAAGVVASAVLTIGAGYLVLGGLPTAHDFEWPRNLLLLPLLGVGSYVTVFCNAVVIATAYERMAGRPATVADGFRRALACLPSLFWWTTLSLVVGVVMQVVADRLKIGGPIVRWILGLAWAVGTFFVVPVIVVERASVGTGIRRSAGLVRQRWGEATAGSLGLGVVGIVFLAVGGLGVGVLATVSVTAAAVVGVGLLSATLALGGALGGVFTAALYGYATGGPTGPFALVDLEAGFRRKRGQ